jgi:hypothetical protein
VGLHHIYYPVEALEKQIVERYTVQGWVLAVFVALVVVAAAIELAELGVQDVSWQSRSSTVVDLKQ